MSKIIKRVEVFGSHAAAPPRPTTGYIVNTVIAHGKETRIDGWYGKWQ